MKKFAFLVHRADYDGFLEHLRRLGVLHVRERQAAESSADLAERRREQKQLADLIRRLEQRQAPPDTAPAGDGPGGPAVARVVEELFDGQEQARQQMQALDRELAGLKPWGDFSPETLRRLREAGVEVRLFICPERQFREEWREQYALEVISVHPPDVYFAVFSRGGEAVDIDAEPQRPPERSPEELRRQRDALDERLRAIDRQLDEHAARHLPRLREALRRLEEEADRLEVIGNTRREAGEALMVLEGFVPRPREADLRELLEAQGIYYLADRPVPGDEPPVLLQNNRFARLFEPIGELFALPSYAELDLTPFFAPFFMMFFGFCLGDAGYGLVVLLGATLYKRRAAAGLRPVLTLAQFLGLATILFGALTGTVFGMNLLEEQFAWLGAARRFMLNSDQAFQLALFLGMVQILFGLVLQGINRYRQYGFLHAISVGGWLLLLLSLFDAAYLDMTGGASTYTAWAGVALILLFNDPSVGILTRIGKGIWELYGLTGIFGDLLSYIRLFALGISSAILGFVINDISLQIKDSIPVLGPVLFVLFLVVGHTANLLISSLGSFVHPMRLTFVEFYKNAGFVGGGKAYRPFAAKDNQQES